MLRTGFYDVGAASLPFNPAAVGASLVPSADNTYDIGSTSAQWKDLYLDATGKLYFYGRGNVQMTADGVVLMTNNAGTSFDRICLGSTSSNPSIVRLAGPGISFQDGTANSTIGIRGSSVSLATSNSANRYTALGFGLNMANNGHVSFQSAADVDSGSTDASIYRSAAGVTRAGTGGAAGSGDFMAEVYRLVDGVTAPSATAGQAKIYVDTGDGDLKVIFGDGTIKTIVTDT